jgi:hypothetical protein
LQPLLNDTVAQLKLSYRSDMAEQRRRYEQLATIIAAWRASDRSDTNDRLLEDWLRGAIRSSMPGAHASLPAAPKFAQSPAPTLPATRESEHFQSPEIPALAAPTAKIPPPATKRPHRQRDGAPAREQTFHDKAYQTDADKTPAPDKGPLAAADSTAEKQPPSDEEPVPDKSVGDPFVDDPEPGE